MEKRLKNKLPGRRSKSVDLSATNLNQDSHNSNCINPVCTRKSCLDQNHRHIAVSPDQIEYLRLRVPMKKSRSVQAMDISEEELDDDIVRRVYIEEGATQFGLMARAEHKDIPDSDAGHVPTRLIKEEVMAKILASLGIDSKEIVTTAEHNDKEASESDSVCKPAGQTKEESMAEILDPLTLAPCKEIVSAAKLKDSFQSSKAHDTTTEDPVDPAEEKRMAMVMAALSIRAPEKVIRRVIQTDMTQDDSEEENDTEDTLIAAEDGDADQRKSDKPIKKIHLVDTFVANQGADENTSKTSIHSDKSIKKSVWIPTSRFSKESPAPVSIKPSKPIFSTHHPMSKKEKNIYFTDILNTLSARKGASKVEDEHGAWIQKEIVEVLEQLDLVSAHQEYLSLLVQMFKDEPHKLTEEFKDEIESQFLEVNEEDRAVMIRFAHLEVEWENLLASDNKQGDKTKDAEMKVTIDKKS